MPEVVLPSRTSVRRMLVCTSFASLPNYYLIAIKKTHAIPHKIILLLFENMTMCVLHFIYVDYELKRCKGS